LNSSKIVIVGATSAIAEACTRLWLQDAPAELVLAARDSEKLRTLANDLQGLSPDTKVNCESLNFTDPQAIKAFVDSTCTRSLPDIVLIAHGYLPDQQMCQQDPVSVMISLEVNGVSPVLFAEAFAAHMTIAGGSIGVIGSIAGDRGRKSNYVYGAAKSLLATYVEGLQHRLVSSPLHVSLVKPGPTKTPKTVRLHKRGLTLAPLSQVAADIVSGMEHHKPVIYTPVRWSLIMPLIRLMPRVIFNRLNI